MGPDLVYAVPIHTHHMHLCVCIYKKRQGSVLGAPGLNYTRGRGAYLGETHAKPYG